MVYDEYNQKILERMERSFDKLMPFCAAASILSAIAIFFSPIPNYFVLVDGAIGSVFIYITALKNIITIEAKIITTILVALIIGVLSFMDGGFGSAGMLLIMSVNLVSVVFLSKKFSVMLSIASAIIFVGLWGYALYNPLDISADVEISKWIIHLIIMMLYLVILHTIVYSVKIYLIENILELEDSVEKTYRYAYFDHLTGLFNNEKFLNELSLVTKKKENGFLVYISVKNLNMINSIYSDEIGDQVLLSITNILKETKKSSELVARIGGNEFALWVPLGMLLAFQQRIQTYLDRLSEDYNIAGMTKQPVFYIASSKHMSNELIMKSIHKTRLALTFAKAHDIHEVVYYDKALDNLIREEDALKELLKVAIIEKEFKVYYQEKICLENNRVKGVEALSRWAVKEFGTVSPNRFVPLVEELNLSIEFGEVMMQLIFNDINKIDYKYGNETSISINISPSHLIQENFSSFLKKQLDVSGIDPHRIILEITEDVMIDNFDIVTKVIKRVKKLGVRFSLDDFGSGYSSLNYLAILDIDELKIDKSFIDQMNKNHKINIMLETIIKLSHQYHLSVVAEGVETKLQYEMLLSLGCDEIQGFYFNHPSPLT